MLQYDNNFRGKEKGKDMKKTNIILSFFALLILFTSCATSIPTRIQRPAELDVSYAETISILPFAQKPGFYCNRAV